MKRVRPGRREGWANAAPPARKVLPGPRARLARKVRLARCSSSTAAW
ncbi:MAG: hypothetical protein SFW67_35175 [Myxococcaceae bacterium]|nr:hypothetical protein [Myxococcaceae bacterium]